MTEQNVHDERPKIRLSTYVADQSGGAVGIVCRKCGGTHFHVVYTRPISGGIRRSRQCRNCGCRVISMERI